MTRITIATTGSRGDVQPFVALGLGLAERGHAVRIASFAPFEEFVRSFGLDFAPITGDPQAMLNQEQGQEWLETGSSGGDFVRGFREIIGPRLAQGTRDALAACADAELVIFAGPTFYVCYSVAEKLQLPFVQAYLQPIHPTRHFPSAIYPSRWGNNSLANYLTHVIGGQTFWQQLRPIVNDVRRDELGLPPLSYFGPFVGMMRNKLPVLYGYSPTLLPKPSDWNDALNVVGFWFLPDRVYEPAAELRAFLEAGPPPTYVGFGSMVTRDPEEMTQLVVDALGQAGQRGIILGGWAGLATGELPDSILHLDAVPHSWLFPQVAAVVHHGGVGTTHEGLRAGRPSVLVPFFGDQPFWAQRVQAVGAGPAGIPRAELTAERLAAVISQAVGDKAMAARAAEIGQQIRQEDGVGKAVALIEAFIAQRPTFDWRGR